MRLKPFEVEAIKTSILERLPGAQIYLFGSRVEDTKRGGDIDLVVHLVTEPSYETKLEIISDIWQKIGEQKIDIIYTHDLKASPFIEIAMSQSVKL